MGLALFLLIGVVSTTVGAPPLLEEDGVVYVNGDGSLGQGRAQVFDQLVFVNGWDKSDANAFCDPKRTDQWRRQNYRSLNDLYTTHKHSRGLVSAPRGMPQRAVRAVGYVGSSLRNAGSGFWSSLSTRWRGRGAPVPPLPPSQDDEEFVMVDRKPLELQDFEEPDGPDELE